MGWQPIQDLPEALLRYKTEDLHSLVSVWLEQRGRLKQRGVLQQFLEKLIRQIAIETGIIERLYTMDRGVTHALIEYGIDASLIPHGATNRPVAEVVAVIQDQENAVKLVFDFVGNNRSLSNSFIKQLHQLLTKNQHTTEAVDQFGTMGEVALIKGDWKRFPNNPTRRDGSVHEYSPPEQVTSQMDQMIVWHLEHIEADVSPEVEAAWLHHRFTQIHPFQDGNGRVARNLATLVFQRARWFPLVVLGDDPNDRMGRDRYISALEAADAGNLMPLIKFFAVSQKMVFLKALGLSETVLSESRSLEAVLDSALERLKLAGIPNLGQQRSRAHEHADTLFEQTGQFLRQTEVSLRQRITQAGYGSQNITIWFNQASRKDDQNYFYRQQVIATAEKLSYAPYLSGYRAWLRLRIRVNGTMTDLIFSLHEVGHDPVGVMVVSAFGTRKDSAEEVTVWGELEAICDAPFSFTYKDSQELLASQFENWLRKTIELGLIYWSKGL